MADKGVNVDDKFLKKFLESGGQAHTQGGGLVNAANLAEFLQNDEEVSEKVKADRETEAKVSAATANDKAAKLHERAEEQRAKLASQEEKAAQKQAESQARQDEKERLAKEKAKNAAVVAAQQAVNNALLPARNLADRAASVHTVGGIGLLLVIIGILLFTVVQVNAQGDTRMKQLWYMLNGRVQLQGKKVLTSTPESSQSITQDFQQMGTALGQLAGDLGNDLANSGQSAIENTPVIGGIYDFFRNLP